MKYLFALFLSLFVLEAFSQEQKILFGFHTEIFKKANRLRISDNSPFGSVESINNIGFGLGSDAYYFASDRITYRMSAGIILEKEETEYASQTSSETKISHTGFVTIGLHSLIKMNKNMPLNIITGFTPYIGIKDNKDKRKDLAYRKFDLTGDLGLSYTFGVKNVTIMPEIKYSRSFINASIDNSDYGISVNEYYRDRFFLTVYLF